MLVCDLCTLIVKPHKYYLITGLQPGAIAGIVIGIVLVVALVLTGVSILVVIKSKSIVRIKHTFYNISFTSNFQASSCRSRKAKNNNLAVTLKCLCHSQVIRWLTGCCKAVHSIVTLICYSSFTHLHCLSPCVYLST